MLRLSILGPLEIYEGNQRITLGSFKQRVVLGLLLCHANRAVPVATLREALWDDPPRTAHKNIQVYVSALRRILTDSPDGGIELAHTPPGYTLRIGPERLDALRFHDLTRRGRRALRADAPAEAADLLGRAIHLWRGPALADLTSVPCLEAEAGTLREQHLAAYEDWAEAKVALGHHDDVVEELDELIVRHPLRERLRHAHMLALYRRGRQGEALAQFDDLRQRLAHDLGIRPSPVLVRLYESILGGDASLAAGPGTRIAAIAARTVGAQRTRLTRDIHDFTGRAGQVEQLIGRLSSGPPGTVTTVTGPTGVGKTALVVHCAHRLGQAFPDGRVLVRLRSVDGGPRPVPDLLADLVRGVRPTGPVPDQPADRAALVREATNGRRMLFLLDDVVSEAQVRAVLAATGDGDVVTTSLRHLGGLEAAGHLAVEPLPDGEAWQLLGRIIGADRVAAEPDAALRLLELCAGLPLLIRIVGAKLTGLPHLTLDRYAERLADPDRLLDQLTAGDLQLRSRLAVACRDLEPDDRNALGRLVTLPGPSFTAADAAARLGSDVPHAETAIERLIETHLVSVTRPEVELHGSAQPDAGHGAGDSLRYTLPWPIRVFVRQQAGAPDAGHGPG